MAPRKKSATTTKKAAAKKKAPAKGAAKNRSSAASKRSSRNDALKILTQDHRDVEAMFARFEGLGDRARKSKADVVSKLIEALSIHASIEEQIFYPAVRQAVPDLNDDVLEGLEEHHVVKWTLSELDGMMPEDERFTPKVTVLMESVRHHVKEEERDIFPKVRRAVGQAELDKMGTRLTEAKNAVPTKPHPRSPDTPPANIVAAALVKPLDTAANIAETAADRVRDLVT